MYRSLACMATVLSLTLLSACGGEEAADTADAAAATGSDRLSKADFVEQGDAICAGLETDISLVEAPTDETTGFAAYIREVVALAEGARDDFAALSPPEDGEQVQQELVDAIDSSIETADGAATAAEEGDTVSAGDLLTQASSEGDAADAAAQDYGFQECGSSSDGEQAPAGGGELTKEDYVAQADAACTQFVADVESIADPAGEEDFSRYLNEVVTAADDARVQLMALTPPADGAQVHEDLVGSFDIYIEGALGAAGAAEQGDTVTAGDLLAQATEDSNAADASAQAYGLQVCGSSAG